MTLWKDLIDIPQEVHKNDFVLKLTEGVEKKEETVKTYVATDELAQAFDQALGLIKSAVTGNKSVAAYLHGSFGSGKSHFMAILNLILEGFQPALDIENLGKVVAKHHWRENKRFLMVPYHMMDAKSMEQAIFGGYIDYIKRHHPSASIPGVFLSERIIQNAEEIRAKVGDEKYFETLNGGRESSSGWGSFAESWNKESYDEAIGAGQGSLQQARLVGDIVARWLPATMDTAKAGDVRYVDLDEGLAIISKHVQTLEAPGGGKYSGLILFLDELVLWLASRSGDTEFLNREGPKVSKLIEAQNAQRATPIISFVARQRDLRDFLGEQHSGNDQFSVWNQLQYWDRGLDVIPLEDRNLPVIVERRLLKPRDAHSREQITQYFQSAINRIEPGQRDIMMTATGDMDFFRKVYPFSPVLVESLIAFSSVLHRERTALRLMLSLLVRRREDLKLGDIIPVGDLWDVVSDQEMPFSDVILQTYRAAQKLYRDKLEPMLRRQHGLEPHQDASNHRGFKSDDRIMKTLLMSALVPGIPAFKELKVNTLLALNYGEVKAAVPGAEISQLNTKLGQWASECGEIRIGQGAVPSVALQLSNIDLEGLLGRVQQQDNEGQRRRKIKELLFSWMGLERAAETTTEYKTNWRGGVRKIKLAYRNVREMPLGDLESPNESWFLVLDFPFDHENYSPGDDLAKLSTFREQYPEGTNTLAWLPAFLSADGRRQLGRLVLIDYLLSRFEAETSHIAATDRPTVRATLESQRNAIESQLQRALESAYGLSNSPNQAVDTTHVPSSHLESLRDGFEPRVPVGLSFQAGLVKISEFMLEAMYPAAPNIPDEPITTGRAQKVADTLIACIESSERRIHVEDRSLRHDLKAYAEMLQLGTMGDTHFSWSDHWRQVIERELEGEKETIALHELHRIIDPPSKPSGMPGPLRDLIVLAYSAMMNMVFKVGGQVYEPRIGKIDEQSTLSLTKLPDTSAWEKGSGRVEQVLGLQKVGLIVNSRNVQRLHASVEQALETKRHLVFQLPEKLVEVGTSLGLTRSEVEQSKRYIASARLKLITTLADKNATDFVEGLAKLDVSPDELEGAKLTFEHAPTMLATLNQVSWQVFGLLLQTGSSAAIGIVDEAKAVLLAAEWVQSLDKLRGIEQRAWMLVNPPVPDTPSGPGPAPSRAIQITLKHDGDTQVLAERLAEALQKYPDFKEWSEEGPVTLDINISKVKA